MEIEEENNEEVKADTNEEEKKAKTEMKRVSKQMKEKFNINSQIKEGFKRSKTGGIVCVKPQFLGKDTTIPKVGNFINFIAVYKQIKRRNKIHISRSPKNFWYPEMVLGDPNSQRNLT